MYGSELQGSLSPNDHDSSTWIISESPGIAQCSQMSPNWDAKLSRLLSMSEASATWIMRLPGQSETTTTMSSLIVDDNWWRPQWNLSVSVLVYSMPFHAIPCHSCLFSSFGDYIPSREIPPRRRPRASARPLARARSSPHWGLAAGWLTGLGKLVLWFMSLLSLLSLLYVFMMFWWCFRIFLCSNSK